MQNTEGAHHPPLPQKAPVPIAYRVFFGQKPALYCQKTSVFYLKYAFLCRNTEGGKLQSIIFLMYSKNKYFVLK